MHAHNLKKKSNELSLLMTFMFHHHQPAASSSLALSHTLFLSCLSRAAELLTISRGNVVVGRQCAARARARRRRRRRRRHPKEGIKYYDHLRALGKNGTTKYLVGGGGGSQCRSKNGTTSLLPLAARQQCIAGGARKTPHTRCGSSGGDFGGAVITYLALTHALPLNI